MSVTVGTPVSSVMTNKRRVGALKSLGVLTVGDALTYYPFRVTDPVPLRAIREARIGEPMAFAAEVRAVRVSSSGARIDIRIDWRLWSTIRRSPPRAASPARWHVWCSSPIRSNTSTG